MTTEPTTYDAPMKVEDELAIHSDHTLSFTLNGDNLSAVLKSATTIAEHYFETEEVVILTSATALQTPDAQVRSFIVNVTAAIVDG